MPPSPRRAAPTTSPAPATRAGLRQDGPVERRTIEVDGSVFVVRVVDGATEVVLHRGPRPGVGFCLSPTASEARIVHEGRRFLRAIDGETGTVSYE